MAKFILCNRVSYDGIELKPGKEIDDVIFSTSRILAGGGVLAPIPNPALEARAAQVRREQAKGQGSRVDSEDLSSAFTESLSGASAKILDVKLSCRLATTANIVLSGLQAIDTIMTAAGDRVLVKNQAAPAANGLYLAKVGAWTRTDDANDDASVTTGLFTFVEEGAVNADQGFILTTDMPITLGTTALVFAIFTSAGGGVPFTRTLTAGNGLTGGGDLSADRTFDVVGNADGSILANANDVQVGVLATDAQHGVRGGGTQHANAVAAGAAGFMTGADKSKLDGVSPLAAALTASAPVNVTKAAAAVGVATDAARADHKHDITTAIVGTIAVGDAAAEGAATSLSRSDHVHALTAPAAPADVTKAAASAGAATTVARSDHKHDVSTAAPVDIGSANAEGAATSLARSNHVHNLTSAVAKAAAASGFTVGSVPFVAAGPTIVEDNSNFFFDDTNNRLGIGRNTFSTTQEKFRVGKPAGNEAYGRIDGALAVGVTDASAFAGLNSVSPFLCFVVGSQLDSDQFGFGNAGLYACARTGAGAGNPPTLAPFTGLSLSDNGALIPLGSPGGGRSIYLGGGGWVAPAANDITFLTAPTYTEVADTDVLRMHINNSGAVNVGAAGATATGLFQVDGTLASVGARFGSLVRHEGAIVDTAVISPAGIGGGTTNNYAPAGLSTTRTIRQSVTAAHVLTGLTAQVAGFRVSIINIATNVLFTLTLNNEDAGSTAANRFTLSGGAALVIPSGGAVDLWYDTTSSRWRVIGKSL